MERLGVFSCDRSITLAAPILMEMFAPHYTPSTVGIKDFCVMNIQTILKQRFEKVLEGMGVDIAAAVEMVRPSQEPKFGDYQANMAIDRKSTRLNSSH